MQTAVILSFIVIVSLFMLVIFVGWIRAQRGHNRDGRLFELKNKIRHIKKIFEKNERELGIAAYQNKQTTEKAQVSANKPTVQEHIKQENISLPAYVTDDNIPLNTVRNEQEYIKVELPQRKLSTSIFALSNAHLK